MLLCFKSDSNWTETEKNILMLMRHLFVKKAAGFLLWLPKIKTNLQQGWIRIDQVKNANSVWKSRHSYG